MKKRTYQLIIGICGGVCAIVSAVVTFIQPNYTPAIVASVGIAQTAVCEILSLFTKDE